MQQSQKGLPLESWPHKPKMNDTIPECTNQVISVVLHNCCSGGMVANESMIIQVHTYLPSLYICVWIG